MIVQNTSAANFGALLNAVRDFLAGNGWTVVSSGPPLIMQNSLGHKYRLRGTTNNRNDFYNGVIVDTTLNLEFDLGNIGLTPGTYSGIGDCNDMTGPFPNIWLFTDEAATFCHIVAQTAPVRYGHASFGIVDAKGLHEAEVDFVAGTYWQYWSDQAQYAGNNGRANPFNDVENGAHQIDHTDGTLWLGIPDGLLDPALFFTDGPVQNQPWRLNDRQGGKSTGVNDTAYWTDYFCNITNKPFAGGIILSPLPLAANPASADVMAIVGELPQMALVNMEGLSPGQTLTLADDEWLVFPWKQFGTAEAMKYGSNPLPQPNSWRYGFAYRSN
jgi:hypothetical protein